MKAIREQLDSQFDWMTEHCTCGDYLSHPDGGDSQCRYCSGAMKMRATMTLLCNVAEAAEHYIADDSDESIAEIISSLAELKGLDDG